MASSNNNLEGVEKPKYAYADTGKPIVSKSSVSQVTCAFHNHTPYTVELFWLNYLSAPISYGTVAPNSSRLLYTYHTHPWVFSVPGDATASAFLGLRGSGKQVAFPFGKHADVHIELVKPVQWKPAVHKERFSSKHPEFTAEIRELLMVHHRLKHFHGEPVFIPATAAGPHATRTNSLPNGPGRASSLTQVLGSPGAYLKNCFSMPSNMCASPPRSWSMPHSEGDDRQRNKRTSGDGSSMAVEASSMVEAPECGQYVSPHLGDLPLDLVIETISYLAPDVPDTKPTVTSDMEMPPAELMSEHVAAEQQILQFLAQQQAMQAHLAQLQAQQAQMAAQVQPLLPAPEPVVAVANHQPANHQPVIANIIDAIDAMAAEEDGDA